MLNVLLVMDYPVMDLQIAQTESFTSADGSVLIFKNVLVESNTISAPSEKVN
jgi:hypothetical protein